MAYQLKSKTGQPIKKDGAPVMGSDQIGVKIEQLDDANLTFIAVASTEDEDRDKDIIRVSGWDLKNFKKNPIIPWSHNYWEVPIAKSIRTWVDATNKRLLFKPKFDKNDEFSLKIFQKYANGFLTSFSVGFRGVEFTERDPNNWWGGKEFTKQELLEVSAVAVPANPNANVNLSYEGAGIVKSMLDIGYPEYFSRRNDEWLFYPIRDVAQFTSPKQVAIENNPGVFAIHAKAIDEEHPEKDAEVIVGYSFDPTQFDKDLAVDFVKENSEKTVKNFYYQVQYDDEKGISIDPKIEDVEITYSSEVKDFNWGDPNSVHYYTYRVYNDNKKTFELVDGEENKTVDDTKKEPEDVKSNEPCVEEPPVPPEPGEPEDLNKVLASVSALELKVNALTEIVDKLSTVIATIEKLVDKQEKVCNNNTEPVDDPDTLEIVEAEVAPQDQKTEVDGDGELEIVDTKVDDPNPEPVNDKSTNSDDTIEIDEADLKIVGIGELVMSGLKENLKKQLSDVVINSGKID